ncbi:BofC C-terminal domain-containing protein [Paenibacillus paeoniae]|uniref:Regulator n=1 Tax=Paenibacillus paeoniae TaxID=2292705 RepID=A0A371PII4_9BACL|nr:BofC C-terminal domain-containing protein [Paenibacillus paeoniae]REK75943.1 regulator [Paenibacillus paeoniae]
MITFSLWKQLKRRLRRNRRPLWTLGGLVCWLLFVSTALTPISVHAADGSEGISQRIQVVTMKSAELNSQPSIIPFLKKRKEAMPVVLQRIYVCGEETEPLGRMSSHEVVMMLSEHPEWNATLQRDNETVMLEHRIEDISDYCREHAHFGVDKRGNFSLFDGTPKEEKVMRTFFQLDIRYMESSLPQRQLELLNQGIRVNDIEEYNSVLSTFSDYAVQNDERAMKQAY